LEDQVLHKTLIAFAAAVTFGCAPAATNASAAGQLSGHGGSGHATGGHAGISRGAARYAGAPRYGRAYGSYRGSGGCPGYGFGYGYGDGYNDSYYGCLGYRGNYVGAPPMGRSTGGILGGFWPY